MTVFLGEIRLFAGNFAPVGWALCQGQTMDISQNSALFNLIGTTYGGDGQTTFNLPDLSSRVPVHMGTSTLGTSYTIGENGGAEAVTLSLQQVPSHSHAPQASSSSAASSTPQSNVWANASDTPYSSSSPAAALDPGAIGSAGGSQPHDNMLPFLGLNFIIALQGVYPSPT